MSHSGAITLRLSYFEIAPHEILIISRLCIILIRGGRVRLKRWLTPLYFLLVTFVLLSFQNCSSQFQIDESPVGFLDSTSLAVPTVSFNPTPLLINAATHTLTFGVDTEPSQIRSVMCQVNVLAAFDCSNFRIELSNLIDGDHPIRVTVVTVAGVSGERSIVIRKDSTVPTLSVSMNPSAQTALTSAQFVFSSNDLLSGVDRIECSLDQANFSVCMSPHSLSNLSMGTHNMRIRAYDRAGNVSIIYNYSWMIDSNAPTVVISSGPQLATNNASATFVFSGVGAQTFQCQLDNAAYANCTSPHAIANVTANSGHTFRVRGVSATGVTGAPVSYSWTHDSIAPAVPVLMSAVSNITNQRNNAVSFSSQDSGTGIARFECMNSGQYATCSSPMNYTNVMDGNYTTQVRAVDQAGNVSVAASVSWVVDTMPPTVVFSQTPVSTTTATTMSFSFTATDSRTMVASLRCSVNMASFTNCTSPVTTSQLTPGSHNFRVQATDQAGNMSQLAHSWTQTAVTNPPDPEVPGNMRNVFLATGHQARTIMSCDDGLTWINDRSDNAAARCWVDGNPNYVECDHTPTSSRGLDAGNGWFYTAYGWGYPGTARRSRDGINWEIISSNRSSNGIILSANGLLTWFSGSGDYPISSDFGTTWSVTRPPGNYFGGGGVARTGNKIWISSDDESRALYSPDGGRTIQAVTVPNLNREVKVAEGNGVLVMLSSRWQNNIQTNFSMRSIDGGATWTSQVVPTGASWSDLIFNGSEFVTWAGNRRYTSRDGQTWTTTQVSISFGVVEGSVSYNPTTQTYVHISNRWGSYYASQRAFRSTNGINWTELSTQAFPGGHPILKIISAPMEARFCP